MPWLKAGGIFRGCEKAGVTWRWSLDTQTRGVKPEGKEFLEKERRYGAQSGDIKGFSGVREGGYRSHVSVGSLGGGGGRCVGGESVWGGGKGGGKAGRTMGTGARGGGRGVSGNPAYNHARPGDKYGQ